MELASNLGFGILVITFLAALFGIGATVYSISKNSLAWVESARRVMLLAFPLLTLVSICLIILLIGGDYQVRYVYNVTSSTMPTYLKITAWWGGQAGSLLFWSWLLAGFSAAATLRKWDQEREFQPWVILVSLVTLAFFVGLVIFIENPFVRFWQTENGNQMAAMFQPANAYPLIPNDGRGLNPLLRHPGMVFHPPMLYLGFVSFVIPFAFAVAALATGRSDDRWIQITRRWTLMAWLFLSIGLVLGMRWAYDVLGWGGYWGWDPVEIAALMPWLSGTAFLHSVIIQGKKRLFKRWNMILIILTYCLVIFGTFLTRSGVISSVHSFAQSAIGPIFFVFIGITFLVSLGLLLYRWNGLHSEGEIKSLLSRESIFLLNNLLFMGILVICFWGVVFPIVSEIFTAQKMTVGAQFYEPATAPLWAGLLLLMGVVPLSAWGASTVKSFGKSIWKPALFSLLVPILAFILNVRNAWALVAIWLVGFVITITLYDYARGVLVRSSGKKENLFLAIRNLTGRNRHRYGGYIVHLGIVIMALGIIGIEMFQQQKQATLKIGDSVQLSGYTLTCTDLYEINPNDGYLIGEAELSVSQGDRYLGNIHPKVEYYFDAQQTRTIPGIRSTLEDDLYIILLDWEAISMAGATFRIFHNPLVIWLWIGSGILILGTLVAAWKEKPSTLT